jgi:hypothetical protein
VALLVLDDAAFAAQERVQNRVDVGDGSAVEPNGSVDEDVTSTDGESDRLRVTSDA